MSAPIAKSLHHWTEQEVAQLVTRLEEDAYDNVLAGLEDWKHLKCLQYTCPELVAPYSYLLELETDED